MEIIETLNSVDIAPPDLPDPAEVIPLRPTTAFVDLDALAQNVRTVRALVGTRQIMAVVKANAYGHGLVPTAKALLSAGVDQLGVAFLEEGIALRRAGVEAPILVLGGIIGNQITHFLRYRLMLTASSLFKLKQIEDAAKATGLHAAVHLKIDTGMERIGVHSHNAKNLFEAAVRAKHLTIAGVFSHLANAESLDQNFTDLQLERFTAAIQQYPSYAPRPLFHIANSAGILSASATHLDMVRPGLMLYGIAPAAHLRTPQLEAVLSLKSRVVYFKVVSQHSPISYGGIYRPERDTRVVTVPTGYGDGYSRALSNRAQLLIRGQRYPVVGRITMDALMADIGRGTAYVDDEVVLIGRQGDAEVSVDELAELSGTIAYEILTNINTRVPRVYFRRSAASQGPTNRP